MRSSKVALIDADILAYQAASSVEHPINWGDGLWTLHSFQDDAKASFEAMVHSLTAKAGSDDYVLMFSSTTNWRKDVLPSYKSNRANTRKPLLLSFLRHWAMENFSFSIQDNLEGDDLLGIAATSRSDVIVVSLDKDLKTVPGYHYNFGKEEFFEITEEQADYWHMLQTLTGDATDGYAGCPGVGPKTAEKILKDKPKEEWWEAVVKAYAKAGLGEEEALVQARVARILRSSDYNATEKQVILWSPNGSH